VQQAPARIRRLFSPNRHASILLDQQGEHHIRRRDKPDSRANSSEGVGCSGGVTGDRRALSPCRPQAPRHPTQVMSWSTGTLIAAVAFHALAVRSLGSRGDGLRATWASERVARPPGSPRQAPRAESGSERVALASQLGSSVEFGARGG
jgi:hypothetical protein